jgi:hypothetical protein
VSTADVTRLVGTVLTDFLRDKSRGIVATAAGVAPYGVFVGGAPLGRTAHDMLTGSLVTVSLNFFIYETLKARFIVVDEDRRSDIGMR